MRAWRAPGRVNLIGEHIDYLGGTVLPFACDLEIVMVTVPHDGEVVLSSTDVEGEVSVPLDGSSAPAGGWGRFVVGVVEALREAGCRPRGFRGILASSIPIAAGLSSSAALEAIVALALLDGDRPPPDVLQRAEQLAVGVPCGVMDQIAVLHGVAGHALAIECADPSWRPVKLPPVGFVVLDTGTRRRLDDGRYESRRREAEAALREAGATDVRPISSARLSRRLRHVASETDRVRLFLAAVHVGDLREMGRLLNECHASLRDDFEVSSPELDEAVGAATARDECLGARLVGGGFGGCALALVRPGSERAFVQALAGSVARAIPVMPVDGAGEMSL